jgi:hypothetical protein
MIIMRAFPPHTQQKKRYIRLFYTQPLWAASPEVPIAD